MKGMGGHVGKELTWDLKRENKQLLRSHRGWKPFTSNSTINKETKPWQPRPEVRQHTAY